MHQIEGGFLDKDIIQTYKNYKTQMIDLPKDIKDSIICLEAGSLDFVPELKEALYSLQAKDGDKYEFGSIKLISFNNVEINKHFCVVYKFKGKPKFISISSTYISMDGEYRHNMVKYKNLMQNLKKNEYDLNDAIVELFTNNDIKIKSYKLDIDKKAIFTIYYMLNYLKFYLNQYNLHSCIDLSKIYKHKEDKELTNRYKNLFDRILKRDSKSGNRNNLVFGCKMIPLAINDFNNSGSISAYTWSEAYINRLINNIIVNGKTRHLPFNFHRALLDTTHFLNIYDNKENIKKMNNSFIGNKIATELFKTKKLLTQGNDHYYINSYFEELGHSIEKSEQLNESLLQYSKYSMLFFNQHRGTTLHSILYSSHENSLVSNYKISHFHNIFTLGYTLYCLNQSGVIHNDLHLNNVTYLNEAMHKDHIAYSIYTLPKLKGTILKKTSDIDESKVFHGKSHIIEYDIPEQEIYYVKNLSYMLTIIDFGRSLIKDYPFENDKEKYIYEQTRKKRIIDVYKTFYPEFYEKNKSHIYLEIDDFSTFFNKYSSVDLLRHITMLIESKVLFQIPNDKSFSKLLKMKHFLEDYLLTTKVRKENANLVFLRTFFKKWTNKPDFQDNSLINHIFCSQSPMYYNLDNYDNFPLYAKIFNMDKINEVCGSQKRILEEREIYAEYKNKKEIDISVL